MSVIPPEDDRTMMDPASARRPAAAPGMQDGDSNALPPGARLGEFEIMHVIGVGGFGIVYLAYDHSLDRNIALKEYMPSTFAARSTDRSVVVKSSRHADLFQAGMRSFINEARLLARFDHPSLVKVYRFWEANGTAYMVMPFYNGMTLKQTLQERGTAPDEAWLKALLAPLMDALDMLHAEHCFHRDIAPDNILMLSDGRPLLLDFGAARRAIGGMAQAFTVILKPGYAPIEQYANVGAMRQGPWTDIYALASVIHFAIVGKAPAPAVGRMISDPQVALAKSAAGSYSESFLRAIDHALAVRPEDRPQSIAELRSLLGMQATPPAPKTIDLHTGTAQEDGDRTRLPPKPPETRPPRYVFIAVLTVLIAAAGILPTLRHRAPADTGRAAPGAAMPSPGAGNKTVAGTAAPKPVDPLEALDQIFQARDREHAVAVELENSQVRIDRDRLQFSIRSSRPGYVYLLMVGTDRSQFWLLFPNDIDRNNKIAAARPLDLPRSTWRMDAAGPPGTDQFLAIVSETPRDFSEAGLKPNGLFSEFSRDAPARSEQQAKGRTPVWAGKPDCKDMQRTRCPDSYGAAMFSIEEIPAK